MNSIVLFAILAFFGGAIFGKNLAKIGINSDNALQNQQKYSIWFLIGILSFLMILILLDKFNLAPLLPQIFPPILLIYLAGYFHEFIIGSGCFFLGLLIFLELSGKRSRVGMGQLMMAVGAISCALSILLFFLQPVQSLVSPSLIINGIVIQTTEYTCAPSAIATLGRYTKKYPQLTEKKAIIYTKTNRFGTTTLRELKALEQLNLNPSYRHNLSLEDLITLNQPALLHVKEKNKDGRGLRFSHAVALLAVDNNRQQFIIGNPYYGLQLKTVRDMQDYWYGEAILVN